MLNLSPFRRSRLLPLAAVAVVVLALAGLLAAPGGAGGLLGTAAATYTVTVTPPVNGFVEFKGLVFYGSSPYSVTHTCGQTDSQTVNDCTASYPQGMVVTATAVPKAGGAFKSWGGSCGTGVPNFVTKNGARCNFTMMGNYTASAVFTTVAVQIQSGNNQSETMGPWVTMRPYGAAAFQPMSVKVLNSGQPVAGVSVRFTCNPPAGFPNVVCYVANGPADTVEVTTDANGIALLNKWNAKDQYGNYTLWYGAWLYNAVFAMRNGCAGDYPLPEAAPFTVTASYGGETATFNQNIAQGAGYMRCS